MRAAIVLAAGASRRFGRADKLFVTLHGEALVLHAIRTACAAPAGRVIVVAAQAGRVRMLVRNAGLRSVVVVPGRGAGAPLSDTLRAGIAALRPIERDAFLFLGDMPGVDPVMARRLVRTPAPTPGVVRPRFAGTPGHPVLARAVRAIPAGSGDRALRPDPATLRWIAGGPRCIADIDRRRDLAAARRRQASARA